jgi:POT family proton-dependent oligopeptide transporter
MGDQQQSGEVTAQQGHPPAIWFFFWGEFAERSSYYGMRAILFAYLTIGLGFSDTDASPIYFAFKMGCYFLPLAGGYIADRWLGRYWTIVGFSAPYVLGQFLLTIPERYTLYPALFLLAGGSGVIKPNISTLLGQTYDQKRPGNETLRRSAFLWFYLSINIGSLLSMTTLPEVRNHYIKSHVSADVRATLVAAEERGDDIVKLAPNDVVRAANSVAFQFPAWLMVAALVFFAAGKRFYALERPEHHDLTPEQRQLRWKTLTSLFGIFALVVLFWFGYEHNDTLWIAFNRDYVNLRLPFVDKTIAPDQPQMLNALFVVILIPVFNVMYSKLDPETKIFTPMRKVLAGFALTTAAVAIMSAAGYLTQSHVAQEMRDGKMVEVCTQKVSVLWPAMAYIVLTFGEVLLYGTMLEIAYAAAPKSMKGFVTACFLVTNAVANLLNMGWSKAYGGSLTDSAAERGWTLPDWLGHAHISLLPGQFFGVTAGVVLFATIAFLFIGSKFQRSHDEAAAAGLT